MEQKAKARTKQHIPLLHEKITGAILDAQRVVQTLYRTHPHYSEANLREAMAIELRARGYEVETEHSFKRLHREQVIGVSRVDLYVNGQVIAEIKIAEDFSDKAIAQMKTYLWDGKLAVGMLLRFGPTSSGFLRVFEPHHAPPRAPAK